MSITNEIKIRPALNHDLVQLVELRKLLLEQGDGHYVVKSESERVHLRTRYKEWLSYKINHDDQTSIAVGCYGDDVIACGIGIIDCRAPMKRVENGKMGWVQSVIVQPNYRGQGIGKKIMFKLFEFFKKNKVMKIALQTNSVAEPMYQNLGFEDSGEKLMIKEIP